MLINDLVRIDDAVRPAQGAFAQGPTDFIADLDFPPMTESRDQTSTKTSIKRGLDFIYRVAATQDGFDNYGSLLICCFALIGATSRDAHLRQLTRSRAQKLAKRWRRAHPGVPTDAGPVFDFLLVQYALSRIGVRDVALNAQIREAAKRFSPQDVLDFDSLIEPPPNDLSYTCDCGLKNERGRTFCKRCRKRLEIQSRYRVWMRALVTTYISERCGVFLGARYVDALKWLPAMRPYPAGVDDDVEPLREAIYAVTHIVYTLNDYSTYRLRPNWMPQEFHFLKANVVAACEREDPEVLGELLDSLKAFGLRSSHPLIMRGTEYLLAAQNEDGSWGDAHEENIRTRCHTTWTAIDGLRTHAWRGERVISREVTSILKR